MKRIIVIHNKYRILGGEDIAVENEIIFLKEHFEVLKKAKVPMYVSAISCEIRGVTEQDLKDANARKVFPKTLLNLSLEADRTFVY